MLEAQNSDTGAKPWERWVVLAGGLMVMTTLGVVYGFSALTEPLQHAFPSWSHHDIHLANTIALLFFALSMAPAGWLQDRYGPRLTPLLAAVLFAVGLSLCSLVRDPAQKNLLYLGYGVLFGSGIGLATVSPLTALNKWFPERRGLISGVTVMGFGVGSALFIPTASAYLQPQGTHTLQEFFRLHALICGVLVAIGGITIKNPPHLRQAAVAAHGQRRDLGWAPMLRTGRFWTLWLMMALSCTAGLMTIAVVKAAMKEAPLITAGQASLAGSILAMFNAFGRPFWGTASDRFGRERTFAMMFAFQAAAMFLLAPGMQLGAIAAYVLVAVIGMNFGGNFALFAPATADAFGTRNLGVNYGLVFTGYGLGAIMGPLVAAYYKDTLGVFAPAYLVAGVLALGAAMVATVLAWRTRQVALQPLTVAPVVDADFADDESWLDRAAD